MIYQFTSTLGSANLCYFANFSQRKTCSPSFELMVIHRCRLDSIFFLRSQAHTHAYGSRVGTRIVRSVFMLLQNGQNLVTTVANHGRFFMKFCIRYHVMGAGCFQSIRLQVHLAIGRIGKFKSAVTHTYEVKPARGGFSCFRLLWLNGLYFDMKNTFFKLKWMHRRRWICWRNHKLVPNYANSKHTGYSFVSTKIKTPSRRANRKRQIC